MFLPIFKNACFVFIHLNYLCSYLSLFCILCYWYWLTDFWLRTPMMWRPNNASFLMVSPKSSFLFHSRNMWCSIFKHCYPPSPRYVDIWDVWTDGRMVVKVFFFPEWSFNFYADGIKEDTVYMKQHKPAVNSSDRAFDWILPQSPQAGFRQCTFSRWCYFWHLKTATVISEVQHSYPSVVRSLLFHHCMFY